MGKKWIKIDKTNSTDTVMIEITKDLIEACFRETNSVPMPQGSDWTAEMTAWSSLVATLGVVQFQTENDIKAFVLNIRDFFIDDMGAFRSSRRIAWDKEDFLDRWIRKSAQEQSFAPQQFKADTDDDEAARKHIEAWKQYRMDRRKIKP